jgi:hypothetical protein
MRTPFKYPDTNSSRAKIDYLNRKFEGQKIAIIGMGGTGSYTLDLVAKTPVEEIHIYDGDVFQLHNAFRAPGAIDGEMLDNNEHLKKVDYYYSVYSNMHNGIVCHPVYVTSENIHEFLKFSYVFISVDKNKVRSDIAQWLVELKVPFIDSGLGVNKIADELIGTLRVTTSTIIKNEHLSKRIGSDEQNGNDYGDNIQIADLNCLNAVLAVLKWKKLSGFYQDLKNEHNTLFFLNTNKLINEDLGT